MNTRNIIFCFLLVTTASQAAPAKFDEVYQLLRNNLQGVSQAELDRAAVKGLLEELPGQVMIVDAQSNGAPAAALSKATVFDDSYAYLRIGAVEHGLAEKLRAAYEDVVKTNKAKVRGVILDLRFAGGSDYSAAAGAADLFLNADRPLLEWGNTTARSTKKADAITVPIAILVNSQTSGAAEGLAAALREGDTGLILGDTTAGQANIFKEFTLDSGEKLRIAAAQVKLGDGSVLSHGLKPDIAVDESLTDERAYLEDPYKVLHAPEPAKNVSNTNSSTAAASEPSHRPTNEAELVRERRAGESPEDEGKISFVPDEPARPVIGDAALARALDLLKGLAVLQQSHPG